MTGTLVASTINAGASAALLLQSNSATALTLDTSQNVTAAGTVAMASSFKRNRIINGNMVISQYNGTSSVTPTASTYNMDRWTAQMTQASKFSVQQVAVSALPGFTYSQNFTVVTPYTVGAGDYFGTEQRIEGYNIADLAWGTANAKSVTLSFWVYANNTGTYCGSLYTSTGSYVYNYTVSAANTWQYVTVTIPGSTAYALGSTTNSTGMNVRWTFAAGSNFQTTANSWVAGNYAVTSGAFNWIGTTSATLYITGVQLEVGTIATPYERQIYSDQLAQCQRYFQTSYFGSPVGTATTTNSVFYTVWANTNYSYLYVNLLVSMRTTPTNVSYSTNNGASGVQYNLSLGNQATTFAQITNYGFTNQITNLAATAGQNYYFHWTASAEL